MTGKLLTGKNMAEFLEIRHIIPVVIIPTKVFSVVAYRYNHSSVVSLLH